MLHKLNDRRRHGSAYALSLIVLLLVAGTSKANPNGYIGVSKTGCGSCHGMSANLATTISVSTKATQILPGQTYDMTVTISNAAEKRGGLDMSASRGKLGSGTGLRLMSGELTQSTPLTFTNGSSSWSFKYTAPAAAGMDTLYIAGNAVNGNGNDDPGDQWNLLAYPITITAGTPQPNMSVSPTPLSFGQASIFGQTVSKTLTIQNTGALPLTIYSYALSATTDFKIVDTTLHSVLPSSSGTVKLLFAPSSGGSKTAQLTINSNDPTNAVTTVTLTGEATTGRPILTTQSTFDIGDVPITGLGIGKSLALTNTGTLALNIYSYSLTGPDASKFFLTDTSIHSIDGGATKFILITAKPSALGPITAALVISSSDPLKPITSVTLTANGALAGVKENSDKAFRITLSQNPATIKSDLLVTMPYAQEASIDLMDAAGAIIRRIPSMTYGEGLSRIALPITNLCSGHYFVRMQLSDGSTYMQGLVIEK